MSVFAVYNIKGGVGKTASVANLSWLAANEGAHTLIWDLDPQGAATFYFRVKPKIKGGAAHLIDNRKRASSVIKATDYENLHLLPADFSYRHLDLKLNSLNQPLRGLTRIIKRLKPAYETIFLDCAPNISLVSENVFESVDVLLIPMIPTTLSIRTLHQLTKFLGKHGLSRLTFLPFFTMVDRRKRLHVNTIKSFLETHPHMLQSYIPYSSDVERMGIERAVLADFAPRSAAMTAYRGVWDEIKARLG